MPVKANLRRDDSRPYKIYSYIRKPRCAPRKGPTEARLFLQRNNPYSEKVMGQINWIVQISRSDMAFEMIYLSTKLKQASICVFLHALNVVTRFKDMEY